MSSVAYENVINTTSVCPHAACGDWVMDPDAQTQHRIIQ